MVQVYKIHRNRLPRSYAWWLSKHYFIDNELEAKGDLHIDAHHTTKVLAMLSAKQLERL